MALSIIFAIVTTIVSISKYQPDIIDPIAGVKQFYFRTYIISMLSLLIIWLIFYAFKKSVRYIVELLSIFLVFSFILLFVFAGMRVHYDKQYNEAYFKYEYKNLNGEQQDIPTEKKVEILPGIFNIIEETKEEHYISECMTAYEVFQTRSYVLMGTHVGINLIIWGFLYKEVRRLLKEKKIREHDNVIFDEEQNVKY